MIGLIENCQTTSLQCGLTLVASCFTFFIMVFALICVIKMWRSNLNLKFESLPLITTLIQSTLQFIQNMFIEDIRILLAGQFIQAITFSFVSMSFIMLFFRTNILKPSRNKFIQSRIKQLSVLYKFAVIGIGIFVICTIKKGDCKNWFEVSYYIPLGLSGFSMLMSVIFGLCLHRKVRQQHAQALLENEKNSELVVFNSVNQHKNLLKQIRLILATYFLTVVAQITLNIVRELLIEKNMVCSNNFIFSTLEDEAAVFIFFFSLIEVTPCLIVPYVFYYVPFSKVNSSKNVVDDIYFMFDGYGSSDEGQTQLSKQQSDQRTTTGISEVEEDLEQSGKNVKGEIISSNFINSARQSQDLSNSLQNNLKVKQFSQQSNSSKNNGNSDRLNQGVRSNENNVQQNHPKKADFVNTEDNRSTTFNGMNALNFGFKKSDFEDKNKEDNE